jgi:hypothetical protein
MRYRACMDTSKRILTKREVTQNPSLSRAHNHKASFPEACSTQCVYNDTSSRLLPVLGIAYSSTGRIGGR